MDDERCRRNVIVATAVIADNNLLRSVIEKCKHEEESDDEYDQWIQEASAFEGRLRIRKYLKRITRIKNYVTTTICDYSGRQFREHFRMNRTTYENLKQLLAPNLVRSAEIGRFNLDVRTQLLAVLWLFATPDSFRAVSDRFGISKSLHDSMRRVVAALNNLADRFIKWPVDDQLNEVKHRFSEIGSLPYMIGAIDECHIPIPAPTIHPIFYRTKKKEYAITLQAVCDANLKFTDYFVGFADSIHARIFRNSDLWHAVTANKNAFFPNNEFIIGDKAYPVLPWCLTPYINRGNLTEAQNNFNMHLSKIRQDIDRAFALLKGRFRRLKYLHMNCADLISYATLARCILHNICLEGCEENIDDFIRYGIEQDTNNNDMNGVIPYRLLNDERRLLRRDYLTALMAHIVYHK